MKYNWGILIIVFFCSCQSHYTNNKTILEAEGLLNAKPDSAYSILSSIKHPDKLSEVDYAAWCLHYSYAQYKLEKNIKSDSLIRVAVNYFRTTNLRKYSGTAYYLLGFYYQFNNKNKDALIYLKEAERLLKETTENNLNGLVTFYIGSICAQDELHNHSLNYYRKSAYYFRRSNNRKYMAYVYREISEMYYQLNYPLDSTTYYLNLALKYSIESKDSVNYYSILLQQGIILREINQKLAKDDLIRGIKYFPSQKQYYSAHLAYVYSKLNMNDSADYYLKISLKDTVNSPLKIIWLHAAALISKNALNYKKAYYYLEKSYDRRDSTYQDNMRSQLYKIDKQFDLTQKEKENVKLISDNQSKLIWITLLVILILFGTIVFLFVSNRIKQKNAKLELEKQYLQFESETVKNQNSQKRELLQVKLKENLTNTLEFNKLKKSFEDSEKRTEFYTQLAKQSMLSADVWPYYIEQANYIFDNGIDEIKKLHPELSKTDLIVIALIGLKIPIGDSFILLNMSKNTMYVRRKTIKKRLGLGPDIDLESWIQTNMNIELTSV